MTDTASLADMVPAELRDARETVQKFKRLLNPVYMSLAYQALGGNEIRDDQYIFTFMGGGGSDMTTVGDFRELMAEEAPPAEPDVPEGER